MPSITRRRLVGGAVAAAAAYSGVRLYRGAPAATFDSWTPAEGTWPLPRYDPANTAHSPDATPPRESPTERVVASAATTARRPHFTPLVGDDALVLHGSELVTYDPDGTPRRERDATTPLAGLGPNGTLHAAHLRGDAPATLVGYAGENTRYRQRLPDDDLDWLTVGDGEAYVGCTDGTLVGVDTATGRDWRVEGSMPALVDDQLYGASAPLDGTVAYAPRTGLDRRLTPGPARRWHTGTDHVHGFYHPPAVANGRLVHGSYRVGGGGVTAVDAETGEHLWGPLSFGADVTTPAVVGDRGFTAVGTEGLAAGRVVALDLRTGETRWRDDTDWHAYAPAVAGETLVVAGQRRQEGDRVGGVVRAYDTSSGAVLWTHDVESGPGGLALVENRVLVTSGADLYELQ